MEVDTLKRVSKGFLAPSDTRTSGDGKHTLSRNHVQKFHPTLKRCASPRLTSSSRSSIAPSKATTMLSLSLLMISGQAAKSSASFGGRLICAHLR
jgi:hypothetical protein